MPGLDEERFCFCLEVLAFQELRRAPLLARARVQSGMRFFFAGVCTLSAGLLSPLAHAQDAGRAPVSVLSRRPVQAPPLNGGQPPTQGQFQGSQPPVVPALSASGLNQTLSGAEQTQNADALLLAYGQAVTDPVLARLAIGQLLANYYSLRNQAQTAQQATQAVGEASLRFQVLQSAQNQVLIQQNQQLLLQNARILALLEANANGRR